MTPTFEPRLVFDMPASEYHAVKALSRSALVELQTKTPLHCKTYQEQPSVPFSETTASRRIGTLVHLAVLEPNRFETDLAIVDGNRNSNSVKLEIETAEATGKLVVKSKELEQVNTMRNAVMNHPLARKIIQDSKTEVSCFWELDGVPCKARFDGLSSDGSTIYDLKYFRGLGNRDIERHIHNSYYHWQQNFYLLGLSKVAPREFYRFQWIFVEDVAPYSVRVVSLDPASFDKTNEEMTPAIERYIHCFKNNEWPAYPQTEVDELALPAWAW